MSIRSFNITLCLCISSLLLTACEEEEVVKEDPAGPPLGILELPVSLRTGDPQPSGFLKVEITPEALRVDDELVAGLEGGRLKEGDRQGDVLPKLKAKFQSATRARVAISAHSMTAYETIAAILSTASSSGVKNVSFQVRPQGGTADTGWINLDNFQVTPRTLDHVEFKTLDARRWDDFAKSWDPVYQACRGAQTGSCAYVPENIAQGGKLNMVLFASGQGVNLNFYRVGLTEDEVKADRAKERERKGPAMIDGLILGGGNVDPAAEVEQAPPASSAMFQFRDKEAFSNPSSVSDAMQPVCGKKACGVIFSADSTTRALLVVALIGAAFPDGDVAPVVAFELPWTPVPKHAKEEPLEPEEAGGEDGDKADK